MAAATLSFAPDPTIPGRVQSAGSLFALCGQLTFTGDYVTGGIALDLEALLKQNGMGKVLAMESVRGYDLEYLPTTKKVKVWVSSGVEHTAATLAATLTGTPVSTVIWGR